MLFILQSTEDEDRCMAKDCALKKSKTITDIVWVACDRCEDWFHTICTNLPHSITKEEVEQLDWLCIKCEGNTNL